MKNMDEVATPMSVAMEPYRDLMEILCEGARAGALALVECRDKQTDEPVAVIAIGIEDEMGNKLVPLARFQPLANPYAGLLAPLADDRPTEQKRRRFVTNKAHRSTSHGTTRRRS